MGMQETGDRRQEEAGRVSVGTEETDKKLDAKPTKA